MWKPAVILHVKHTMCWCSSTRNKKIQHRHLISQKSGNPTIAKKKWSTTDDQMLNSSRTPKGSVFFAITDSTLSIFHVLSKLRFNLSVHTAIHTSHRVFYADFYASFSCRKFSRTTTANQKCSLNCDYCNTHDSPKLFLCEVIRSLHRIRT